MAGFVCGILRGLGVRRPGELTPAAPAKQRELQPLKPIEGCLVGLGACALPQHRAVPGEAEALEIGEDPVGGARSLAGRIEILDADQPAPAADARLEAAGEGGQQ
jgi:hypothetical protein